MGALARVPLAMGAFVVGALAVGVLGMGAFAVGAVAIVVVFLPNDHYERYRVKSYLSLNFRASRNIIY